MYNFDFTGANRILDDQIRQQSDDPLLYSFRAASLLFQELDRLMILDGEFFTDDKRIIEKRKLQADPQVKRQFDDFVDKARQRAQTKLAAQPSEVGSLFTMSVTSGLVTDYMALIDKRQLMSLSHARESQSYAVKLLKIDPGFSDAYLTTGITEYLLGSIPFFIRWFLRFDDAHGDKNLAVARLERVATTGHYFGPFAKILLSIIHLREKRPQASEKLLTQLAAEFPENALIRKELGKVRTLMAPGSVSK